MYLISIYFDEKTEYKMQCLMNQIADVTGNTFMIDNKIPPHITLQAFDIRDEERAIQVFEKNVCEFISGSLLFASIGVFKKQVLYLEPVLNEYLHNIYLETYKMLENMQGVKFSPYYKPFSWIPHASLGKHLDENQLKQAFGLLLKEFNMFEGKVTRIGISKTNPHRDILVKKIVK